MRVFECENVPVKVRRVSRWITINHTCNVNKRNSLYYYATDGSGYKTGDSRFNPADGVYLDYFVHNGRKYALDQFILLACQWGPGKNYVFTENGEKHVICSYDSENYYNPLLLEISDNCEQVRLYEQI